MIKKDCINLKSCGKKECEASNETENCNFYDNSKEDILDAQNLQIMVDDENLLLELSFDLETSEKLEQMAKNRNIKTEQLIQDIIDNNLLDELK